jgi:prepilin-type N-terminal cleavage/methylation domain-containing protein
MNNRVAIRPLHGGFSLLEVILALAILTGGIAVLGELSRQGLDCAHYSRDSARGQLICQSKIEEIVSGVQYPTTISATDSGIVYKIGDPIWLYSVDVEQTNYPGLLMIRVTATPDLPAHTKPNQVTMVRWMIDPALADQLRAEVEAAQTQAQADADAAAAQSQSESQSSSTSSSGTSAG